MPKPKETDWELELPEEQDEANGEIELSEEDAAERDRRNQAIREANERADFQRRTQVLQRQLPRPSIVDVDTLLKNASSVPDTPEGAIAKEMALLIINDAFKYPNPGTKVIGSSRPFEIFDDDSLNRARLEIALEMPSDGAEERQRSFEQAWTKVHDSFPLPVLASFAEDEKEKQQLLIRAFDVSLCILPSFLTPLLTPSLKVSPNLRY